MVIFVSGCKSIGDFDVNKALTEAVIAKSMEGTGEFSLNLIRDEKAQVPAEEQAMLKLFETTKFKFDSIKMESSTRVSIKGLASIRTYSIPFQASVSEEQIVLQIDGGKKPIVFQLQDEASNASMKAFVTELQSKLKDGKLSNSMMSYLIKQLPNPSKLNVDNVVETINGEKVSLHKLHGEITGKELLPLAKSFIKNMMKDDQALKELIGQLYDALYPMISAEWEKALAANSSKKGNFSKDADHLDEMDDMPNLGINPLNQFKSTVEPIMTGVKAVLDDRDSAIEVIHTEVKQIFVILLVALETLGHDDKKPWEATFNESSYMNTDLYFDNSLKLRKSNTTVMIAPQLEVTQGVSAVKITMSSENWNVNGKVKADVIATDGGSLVLDKASKPNDILKNFDPKSAIYQLLKQDLKIGKVSFPLFLGNGEYFPKSQQPFIENGVTMVPTRFISERLNAELAWDSVTQNITITDPETSRTIVLHIGSNVAIVDGKNMDMEQAVLTKDDQSFVPLTFIVTQFGGKTEWNNEMRMIQVTRD
ncbi:copper amine oxidase N-terminal domain-containing protein [Paenibacillus planticolens]|uniref:copper amine oxidase N-terminal domain-containing protein n=1 Tax=Paenibacillus planticolens TaxID=2654976 RepID=UPI0014925318|nr:copper amine oxidase N-terminal domain-containing protein [Paenibacillus planticolens]